ncbi:hypothetical protein [Citricoccus nitrophenolicus]|uniref:hypothetical protein n=1 Tax=Citricoccus nitrophenolicus TaxID=863575 RepID=UPI0031EDCFDF
MITTAKTCTRCGDTKPLDQFQKSKKGKHGREARCKTCIAAYRRDNAERIRAGKAAWHQAKKTASTTPTVRDRIWTRGNWRAIPGLNGYEISYSGRLRKQATDGPKIVKANGIGPCGFYTVWIEEDGHYHQVGTLAAAAWIGPKPDGLTVRYLDGNLQNHNVANLAYGTVAELRADQAARAEREEAAGAPTHCEQGHRLAPRWESGWGERYCRECTNIHSRNSPDEAPEEPEETICEQCGTLAFGLLPTQLICNDCREQNLELAAAPRLYTCLDCDTEHKAEKNNGPLPQRCPDCWEKVRATPPRYYTCQGCQSEHRAENRMGPVPKWCPDCQKKAASERSLRWYERKKQNR